MGDVKDILGISQPKDGVSIPIKMGLKSSSSKITSPPDFDKRKKRPTGLNREVIQLQTDIDSFNPSIRLEINEIESKQQKYKTQIDLKTSKWVKRPFYHDSRTDHHPFYHWEKEHDDYESYLFSKFSKKPSILIYTDDEYNQYLISNDWTKKDTDTLFYLCDLFELRFHIIHDRWLNYSNVNYSIESLMDRYYSVSNKILNIRCKDDNELMNHPLYNFKYDIQKEIDRKRYYEQLTDKTEEQLLNEESLLVEFGRIHSSFQRHSRETQKLIKQISKQQQSFNLYKEKLLKKAEEENRKIQQKLLSKKKRKSSTNDDDDDGIYTTTKKKKKIKKPQQKNNDTQQIPQIKQEKKESLASIKTGMTSNTFVTSAQYQKYQTQIASGLVELGIDPRPRSNPIASFYLQEIKSDIVLLLEMQKVIAEKNYQLAVLKKYYDNLINK